MGSKCFLRSGSESEGWPSDWIFKNQFEKVNIRMEEFSRYSFGFEDLCVIKASVKKQWILNPGLPTRVPGTC